MKRSCNSFTISPTARNWHGGRIRRCRGNGSEGNLIDEFLTLRTNQRSHQWGGDYRNRMRFA
ncbi:hypothetical protein ACNKHX_18950 [Shigella flexneri]